MTEKPLFSPSNITVHMEPEGVALTLPRPSSALQLLRKLNIRRGTALVIRQGELLTPDREIRSGDTITVRIVTSMG